METVEAEGGSIDEAIATALVHLGVARERVEVEILANATRGFFGLGGKRARIRATVRRPLDDGAALSPPSAAAPSAPAPDVAAAPPRRSEPVLERARQALSEIVRLTGVPATVALAGDGEGLVIEGDPSGTFIGRSGQTLDALEFVVNRIVGDAGEDAPRVSVDANGYRARRRAGLEDQARRLAARAGASGRPQSLPPLPPRDRRIVHLALHGDPAVTTRSTGDGYLRTLIIAPAGRRRRAPRSA
jgi:spoIIIJ-associated protein